MRIRPAKYLEVERITDFAQIMHAESRFAERYPFDYEKVRALVGNAVLKEDWYCAVFPVNGEIIGAIVGCVGEQFFSTARVAQDAGLFVRPDKRGSHAASRLVLGFAKWAREQGAVDCEIGANTGVNPERTARLLEICGFEQVGTLFSKRVN